ncbi:MAG: hypothetical protein OXG58_09695 [Gemmatimonadetes bacterium]|nr:hypothetical protein [Gemmatimonadota bacterium]MCY3943490.1 hypothetical protein [Gemmatimonadota bacterium]
MLMLPDTFGNSIVRFAASVGVVVGSLSCGTGPPDPASDRDLLEDLYESTGGEEWTDNSGWLEASLLGDWYGVTTHNGTEDVARLELGENNLAGGIPSTLGELASVEAIWLYGNQLRGGIPESLGDLDGLLDLSLRDNQLNGEIPATLGNLSSLEQLSLQRNELEGRVPALGNLTSLVGLFLHENRLTGAIPSALGDLAALEELSLRDNQLTGEIPLLSGRSRLSQAAGAPAQRPGGCPALLPGKPDGAGAPAPEWQRRPVGAIAPEPEQPCHASDVGCAGNGPVRTDRFRPPSVAGGDRDAARRP